MASSAKRLGTVFLARAAEGNDALVRFAASYARHEAGAPHDLVVIYKGFTSTAGLERARAAFVGIAHLGIELDDTGFDIGSYVEASRRLDHESLCFLNTHSEILAGGWLGALAGQHRREGVGLVGAMGSYESLSNSVPLMERAIALAQQPNSRPSSALLRYYDFLLPRFRPDWYGIGPSPSPPVRRGQDVLAAWLGRSRSGPRGTALIWPGAPELDMRAFPPFPNPHVRSNGFLISRLRLLHSNLHVVRTKADANLFESGRDSLTSQICRAGLAVVIAGRGGAAYEISNWPKSRTFRLSDQANLLIGDNHTRAFNDMSDDGRTTHQRMTWGDYLGAAPDDFPDFRIRFPIKTPAMRLAKANRHAGAAAFAEDASSFRAPASDLPTSSSHNMDGLMSAEAKRQTTTDIHPRPIMSTKQLPVRPWIVVFRAGQVFSLAVEDIDRFPFEDGDELAVEPADLAGRWFRTPDQDLHVPVAPGIGVRVPPIMEIVEFKGYRMPKHLVRLTGAGIETFQHLGQAHLTNYGQVVPLRSDMTFLEIGSGMGRDALQLAEVIGPEGRYYAIDVQRESIVWCQNNITKRHPNFTFHHFNAEHELHNPLATKTTLDFSLPAPDGSVDFVALGSVLTHLFEPEVRYYLREIARVLNTDGLCYATFFLWREDVVEASRRNNLTPYSLTFEHRYAEGCYISNPQYPTGSVAFTQEKMSAMIADAGLVLDRPYIMGEWSGLFPVQEIRDGQDVAVLRRANPQFALEPQRSS